MSHSSATPFSRRLLLTGGAGAIAALGLSRTSHADAAAADRFNLTGTPSALMTNRALQDETVLQSFAFRQLERASVHRAGPLRVYNLSAVKAGGTPERLFDVPQPTGLGTFQGYTAYGNHLYLLESLTHREPEGMAIQIAAGAPRLCFGFASGDPGARRADIIYKNTLA
jgi:hypothetical protein